MTIVETRYGTRRCAMQSPDPIDARENESPPRDEHHVRPSGRVDPDAANQTSNEGSECRDEDFFEAHLGTRPDVPNDRREEEEPDSRENDGGHGARGAARAVPFRA